MTRPIEYIKRHYDDKGVNSFEVQEWQDDQGKPLTIYYEPLTVKDKDHLQTLHKKYGDSVQWLVHVLILHAKDAQGAPLFTLEDKRTFMRHADAAVVERVAAKILLDGGDIETQKKN
jgi:hypothetical protein